MLFLSGYFDLNLKIKNSSFDRLDWALVREDANALLRERDQATLKLWSDEYFHNLVKRWQ
jgi:hypothetical protein